MNNKGIWFAVGAYSAWGLLPLYWKFLHHLDAMQIISHRIIWSCLILALVLTVTRQWRSFRGAIVKPRVLPIYFIAAVLVGLNWLVYVWAVNANFVVETSLGYFINPLISVLLGVIFLRERLRLGQWIPIGLAALGVLYLTLSYGQPPWIAITLALSFGLYGLVKKVAPLGSVFGLALETSILFIPALGYLLYADSIGQGAFIHEGWVITLLLAGAGLVTTVPMLMFASAAQRIPLSLVGILQYIAPTLQFLLGVLVYKEPFSQTQAIGFGIVWVALILFAAEGLLARRMRAVTAPAAD